MSDPLPAASPGHPPARCGSPASLDSGVLVGPDRTAPMAIRVARYGSPPRPPDQVPAGFDHRAASGRASPKGDWNVRRYAAGETPVCLLKCARMLVAVPNPHAAATASTGVL